MWQSKRANFDPSHELEEILLEDNPLKVRKRSKPVASNAGGSIKSQISQNPDQPPEMHIMDTKFLVYDFTKPHENTMRRQEFEQQRWAHKAPQGKTDMPSRPVMDASVYHKPSGSNKSSVLDQLNSKPAPPITAGDILKMDELARMARVSGSHSPDAEFRPPSGILSPSHLDSKLYQRPVPNLSYSTPSIQKRDNYIQQEGGIPPSSRPPQTGPRRYSEPRYNDDLDPFVDNPSSPGTAPSYTSEYQVTSDQRQYDRAEVIYRRRLSEESSNVPPSPNPSETALLKSHRYVTDTSSQAPMPPPQQPPPPIPSHPPVYLPHRVSSRPSGEKLNMISTSLQSGYASQSSPSTPIPAGPPRLPPTSPIPPVPSSGFNPPRPAYNSSNASSRSAMQPLPPPQTSPPPIPLPLPPLPR